MGCLFYRKMDIHRVIKMLKSHIKWRMEQGYERIPKWDDLDKDLLGDNFSYFIPGTRSKEGCSILYANLSRMVPGDHGKDFVRNIMDIMIWNNCIGTFYENLDFHRNGLIFICDLEGFGLRNLDFNLQRKINSAMIDNFPMRINKVLLVNPPSILETVLAGIRLFMKKKIMDRIQIIHREDVLEYIDAEQLSSEYGGDIEYSSTHFINFANDLHDNYPHLDFKTIKKKMKKG